ncbi:hypothetical protein L1049_026314 [Liquidambar formosana]|uniref:Uncharacterized protein n=1 Tax=Liquidambar formosana TaxID=63359 RepID=A0AAP0NEI7_LIQFO
MHDGTVITPVEIGGKIVGREDRSLLSVVGKPETPHAEIVPAEFRRRQIGELSDAVDGGGVELLVPFGAAQVSLEDSRTGNRAPPAWRRSYRTFVLNAEKWCSALKRRSSPPSGTTWRIKKSSASSADTADGAAENNREGRRRRVKRGRRAIGREMRGCVGNRREIPIYCFGVL